MCTLMLFYSLLSAVDESQENTLVDAISALMIFCKSDELKAQGTPILLSAYCPLVHNHLILLLVCSVPLEL